MPSTTPTPPGDAAGFAKAGWSDVLDLGFTYDVLGRIVTKTDTGVAWSYGYDLAGHLADVKKSRANVATYTYDANGNGLTVGATYDDEDRQLTGDGATSTYTPNAVDGTKVNMPDYFERGGTTYAVSTDQLGSAPTDVHPV